MCVRSHACGCVRSGAHRSDNADCADSAKRSNDTAHSAGSDTAVHAACHTADYHADNANDKHGTSLPYHA